MTLVMTMATPARALRQPEPTFEPRGIERTLANPLVRRAQKALKNIGRYKGPVDGRMNRRLDRAIRAYQRTAGLAADGQVTDGLIERLETGGKVEALLKRLDQTRRRERAAAMKALLSTPETSALIKSGERKPDVADPTRNPEECFRRPTARCLLAESLESAKAINQTEMRDWALGELLVAQAKAGMTREAMDTVSRIRDPRLIMVALRNIAEAQAASGTGADAIAAAEIIPDPLKQAEAFAAITKIQTRRKDFNDARKTARRLVGAISGVKDKLRRLAFHARAAVAFGKAGDEKAAGRQMNIARKLSATLDGAARKSAGLRQVASALAELDRPEQALALLEKSGAGTERTPVLVNTAMAQARAGDGARALETAYGIKAVRYRSVVLTRIAEAQMETGDKAGARKTVNLAIAAAAGIKLPFARSFAMSRIARTLAGLGGDDFEAAVKAARKIKDNRLRAHTLWIITAERLHAGKREGAAATAALAESATAKIKSTLNRMWMFSELALEQAASPEPEAASADFKRALKIAETIQNAWARTRALGQLAAVLVELTKSGHAPSR
jgi:hypothetical protein